MLFQYSAYVGHSKEHFILRQMLHDTCQATIFRTCAMFIMTNVARNIYSMQLTNWCKRTETCCMTRAMQHLSLCKPTCKIFPPLINTAVGRTQNKLGIKFYLFIRL